jgi:hypothetical protein
MQNKPVFIVTGFNLHIGKDKDLKALQPLQEVISA